MNPTRAILAWLAAVVATSWCGLFVMLLPGGDFLAAVSGSIAMLPAVALLGALFGAVPSVIAVWMLRWSRAPRPLGDVVAAAVASAAALLVFSPGFSAGTVVALFLLIGAVPGGLVYWFFAGRPRPWEYVKESGRGRISLLTVAVHVGIAALLAVWMLPKIRTHPLSAGITNNNWSHSITYSDSEAFDVVHCDFIGHDSSPYWEGQSEMDHDVCSQIPVYLHEGLPPLVVDHRGVELRAPLIWGRLI